MRFSRCAFALLKLKGHDLRREPIDVRKRQLATLLRHARVGLQLNEHIACLQARFRGYRQRLALPLRPLAALHRAVRREAEEDWGKKKWR